MSFAWKILFNSLGNCKETKKNEIITLISYLKQDNVANKCPPPQHNIILFELDLKVKFSLLHLLYFLTDLKNTIFFIHFDSRFILFLY